ncbi:hypothetical protein ACSBR2_032447 [Camellia fascicularis]
MSPTQRDVGLPNIPLVHCSCTRLAPPLTCLDLRPTPFDASCFFQLHTSHCHFRSVGYNFCSHHLMRSSERQSVPALTIPYFKVTTEFLHETDFAFSLLIQVVCLLHTSIDSY